MMELALLFKRNVLSFSGIQSSLPSNSAMNCGRQHVQGTGWMHIKDFFPHTVYFAFICIHFAHQNLTFGKVHTASMIGIF